MNISRDVVRDLLTVYLAGDASQDTRTLVEDYLARDPVLKAEAEAATETGAPFPFTPPVSQQTSEKEALDKTRALLKAKTSTLVLAVLFSALPFVFTFSGSRIEFVVLRDAPVVAAAWWLTAAVMWVCHIRVRRRLSTAGL